MIDFTFADARAYNYNDGDREYIIAFGMHEIAGEPGCHRFTANVYDERGRYVTNVYDERCDYDAFKRDMEGFVDALLEHAAACIRSAFECFDVVHDLFAGGSRWHPTVNCGRYILADTFEREGVDCYPLTNEDVQRIAAHRIAD